ncbi:hypothetical protein GCM10009731_63330 [Streptomyces globosus]
MSDPSVLRFSLLGPVQAGRGGVDVPLGPPQQRLVLAILLLRRPGVAGLDELIDGIWGEASPRTAAGTVRSYVYRLRRALGPCLVTEGGGYALDVPDGAVDLADFEAEAARGRELVAAGDPDAGARMLEAALARWRGVPLAGLPGPFARIQRERLAELRLSVLLERVEADLARGRHARLVPELGALCAEYPLNGRLRALRAEALARAGRAEEAGAASARPGGRPAPVEAGRAEASARPVPVRAEGPAGAAARELPGAHSGLADTPARPTAGRAGAPPAAAEAPVRQGAENASAAVTPGTGTLDPSAGALARAPEMRPAATPSGVHPPGAGTGRRLQAAPPPLPEPAQLPYATVDFTGRETATRRLVEALTPAARRPWWSPPSAGSAASARPRSRCTPRTASGRTSATGSSTPTSAGSARTRRGRRPSWRRSSAPSASPTPRFRRAWRSAPDSTARGWRTSGCCSSSTMRGTSGRSSRCCRVRPPARSS